MITRGGNFKSIPLNIVGSSTFGRYPKISIEKTYNMFISDNWLVNYPGYEVAIPQSRLGSVGRGIHTSTKLNRMVVVVDNKVYLVNIFFDQSLEMSVDYSATLIGTLQTSTGDVYISENNKPQVLISDNQALYLYDPLVSPTIQPVTGLDFTPGYIDFHDTYFLCAASNNTAYTPPANNTWRLSAENDGSSWPNDAAHVGLLQTKPDNVKAVVRVPSGGNMILVMGETVTEQWFDVGYQLFPYQRSTSISIDYGCLNPATIATTDKIVAWLARNEKSGPIIMYTEGGEPKKITTDGIDYLFSNLTAPEDSEGFIFRQDGHLIYHLNFYTDNISIFYDFNTDKFFFASDENMNYFIASEVAYFNNQYYFVSRNDGNLYAFDTIYTTYAGKTVPRIRTCKNIRLPSQEYFVANDVGFTIETGETDYETQTLVNGDTVYTTPAVDLSISVNGGATFGSDFRYELFPIGKRRNRLMWWQCGAANDLVCQFRFWGMGRFVATDGLVNIRQ